MTANQVSQGRQGLGYLQIAAPQPLPPAWPAGGRGTTETKLQGQVGATLKTGRHDKKLQDNQRRPTRGPGTDVIENLLSLLMRFCRTKIRPERLQQIAFIHMWRKWQQPSTPRPGIQAYSFFLLLFDLGSQAAKSIEQARALIAGLHEPHRLADQAKPGQRQLLEGAKGIGEELRIHRAVPGGEKVGAGVRVRFRVIWLRFAMNRRPDPEN